jgi:hypothetical protein
MDIVLWESLLSRLVEMQEAQARAVCRAPLEWLQLFAHGLNAVPEEHYSKHQWRYPG